MSRVELVVFDWDGTLVDSAGRIVAAVEAAIAEAGLPRRDAASIRAVIGLGMAEAVATLFPEQPGDARERLIAAYRRAFVERAQARPAELFPGVAGMLAALGREQRLLAIATGKSRAGLERELDETGVGHRFAATRTVDEAASKPAPTMLEQLLACCGTDPAAALVVGDTLFDLEMATRAGVPALGVGWGAHPADALWRARPLAVLERPEDLPRWLRRHERGSGGDA